MYTAWICETCERPNRTSGDIWDCLGCGKECCERCFDRNGHCKACATGKSDRELIEVANANGFDFELIAETQPEENPR